MWVEETNNGKFKFIERYEDFMTGKTKRVSVTLDKNTAATRKVALQTLNRKIDAALSNPEKKDITLSQLVEHYRASQSTEVKQSTYRRNYFACNTILEILGKDILVERMTAKYVRERFLATGESHSTLNERMVRFKALIRWGYQNDYIKAISFLDKLEPFKDIPHREKIQDKFLEAEELKRLTECMGITSWKLLTEFLALSGLRIGEAIALLKSDVDTTARMIHITKTFDNNNLVVTSPKTLCSIRDVYMQEELKELCHKINAYMLRQSLACSSEPSELFLTKRDGGYIRYYAYKKYLQETALKSLGREITPHTLRHTHASLLLEQGVSIDAISRRLGHENSQVTREIYLHVTERLKEKDNEQIAQIKIM